MDVRPCDDPTTIWKRARNVTALKDLAEIALHLLTFPMSGVAVERSFSVIRHIHTWKRNRIGGETLAKLAYIRINRQWERKTF